MGWDDGDEYEVVGNGKKDLIVRLGFGFCSADDVGAAGALCKDTDRDVPALTVPLNTDLGAAGDLVTLDTEGDLSLNYAARAQLDIGIPLKLDLTPDVAVLDTTKAEVEARLEANGVGLNASIGPVEVQLGTAVTDADPGTSRRPGRHGRRQARRRALDHEGRRRMPVTTRSTTRSTTTAPSRSATSSPTSTSTSRAPIRI